MARRPDNTKDVRSTKDSTSGGSTADSGLDPQSGTADLSNAESGAAQGADQGTSRRYAPLIPRGIELANVTQGFINRAATRFQSEHPSPLSILLSGCQHGLKDRQNAFGWLMSWVRDARRIDLPAAVANMLARTGKRSEGDGPENFDAVLRLAARYAMKLSGQSWVDSRHLLLALLTPHRKLMVASDREYLHTYLGGPIGEFSSEFLKRIEQDPTDGEREGGRLERWRSVCNGIQRGEVASEHKVWLDNLGLAELSLGAFNPETVDNAKDTIGITDDVRAFARLFAARPPVMAPPLSVGLFGAWGSGKSFFMRRLEEEVQRIAQDADPDSVFMSRVVQIRFNAWHYADADIWASMTSAFFDQLQHGGANKARDARYAALVRNVAMRAKLTDAASLATKAAELQAVDKSLVSLERKQTLLSNSAAAETEAVLQVIADNIDAETRASLKRLGIPDPSGIAAGTAKGFAAVRGFRALLGKVANFSRRLTVATIVIAVVAAGMVGIALARANTWKIDDFLLSAAATGSVLLGIVKFVERLVGKGTAFLQNIEDKKAEIEKKSAQEVAKIAEEMKALKQKRDALRAEIDGAQVDRREDNGSAAGVLEHFLVSSGERERFDAALGLVSRARLAFETLDTILSEATTPDAKPDRIVLYIDDLDRCAPDQVYKVLQAVHLLIGFPHFVTVVGVDERWVRNALEQHATFGAGVPTSDGQRSSDYLEKIFQIPFWLRPLTTSEGGTYSALIDNLGTPNDGVAPPTISVVPSGQAAAPGDASMDNTLDQTSVNPKPAVEVSVKPEKKRESLSEQIEFTKDELDCMRVLGPLAAKSPRAVKRFVNTCRLIRVREGESNPAYYFGTGDHVPGFEAIMLALAVEIGRSRAESEVLFSRIRSMNGIELGLAPYELKDAEWMTDFERLFAWVSDKGKTSDVYWKRAFATARRYSFNALAAGDADWLA